jgi:hypothetical protein
MPMGSATPPGGYRAGQRPNRPNAPSRSPVSPGCTWAPVPSAIWSMPACLHEKARCACPFTPRRARGSKPRPALFNRGLMCNRNAASRSPVWPGCAWAPVPSAVLSARECLNGGRGAPRSKVYKGRIAMAPMKCHRASAEARSGDSVSRRALAGRRCWVGYAAGVVWNVMSRHRRCSGWDTRPVPEGLRCWGQESSGAPSGI